MRAQVGLIFGKMAAAGGFAAAALQEDTPFEETPAGAFLSERF
jgi:hypothetical protein